MSMAAHDNLTRAVAQVETKHVRVVATDDPDVVLHLPEQDVDEPELSIVIPAADEEIAVGEFVEWCKEGLAKAGIVGEVVIVSSSTDRTG